MFVDRPPRLELREPASDAGDLGDLAGAVGASELTVRLCVTRRPELANEDALRRWLDPRLSQLRRPDGMAGFAEALELLRHAVEREVRVGVFGDYDADGVTSTCILSSFLRSMGVPVLATVASREGGYGFTLERARRLADAGCEVVLTADCGTSDHEALSFLRGRGIKTAVIDHHQVPEVPPPTDAFINPWQPGCGFAFRHLCSAGVAFYLCAALRTHLRQRGGSTSIPDPRAWLDVAAIGTVCDMVRLEDENRILVRQGLSGEGFRRRPALRALLAKGRVGPSQEVTENFISFTVGPRLNAPGRLGSAEPALRLLCAGTDGEARATLREVEGINRTRREFQNRVMQEAQAMLDGSSDLLDAPAVVLASDGWLHGVVGIAASNLASRYGRPAFIMAEDAGTGELRGSVRTSGSVDVLEVLRGCAPLLMRHGGHPAAAGFSLERENLDAFRRGVHSGVLAQTRASGEPPTTPVDLDASLAEVTPAMVRALRAAGPFGQGFTGPNLLCQGAVVRAQRPFAQHHLELVVEQAGSEGRVVLFGGAGAPISPGQRVSFTFEPEFDAYRGGDALSLRASELWLS